MKVVTRTFRQISPESIEETSRPLSGYYDRSALVILGEPGAGKTTSFDLAAKDEPNAVYLNVRDFLTLSPDRWKGKTLYLDGLDEQRAKNPDGSAVLDQVRSKLDQLGQPRFRLSCRAADWYGSSDAERLRLVSPDQSITVLLLEPLTEGNIIEAISDEITDPPVFLAEAKRRQIYELLTNPQTLRMIVSVVATGSWPDTKTEVYSRACSILAREHSDEHARTQGAHFTEEDILDAAGYLCAVQLCTGIAGFSLSIQCADPDNPQLKLLKQNDELLDATVRRRIFTSNSPERVAPIHRTIAEYLAARYVIGKIRNGFPVGRALALLTGYDGGTLSDLRGLYAWLTCLCHEHAALLIPKDPLGIILYGDAAVFAPSAKRLVIENLAKQSQQNPWFRSENWAAQPFGGLASAEMEPIFRDILQDTSHHPVLVSCVLDAIAYGTPLPNLADLLIKIARNDERSISIREDALAAFKNVHPDPAPALLGLLRDINSGKITDKDCRLRGELLSTLYPRTISPKQITNYLVDEPAHFIGKYSLFLDHQLLESTPSEDIPALLDGIAKSKRPLHRSHQFTWQRFLSRLLIRGLNEHGTQASMDQLYSWLGIVLDEYGSPVMERQQSEAIQAWLEQHPDIVKGLFWHWLSLTTAERLWRDDYAFWQRLHHATRPRGFSQELLERAKDEANSDIADFLFRQAVRLRTQVDRAEATTLDEILEYVAKHPRFQTALHLELYCEIPDWHMEQAQHRQRCQQERANTRRDQIECLSKEIDKIKAATSGNLVFLAKVYFGLFIDVDCEASPLERLVAETNSEIAEAALQGFIATLRRRDLPPPDEIGKLHVKSRIYNIGFSVLAGMDVIATRNLSDISALRRSTKAAALAFHYANTTGDDRKWVRRIPSTEPEVSAQALVAFWRPQLSRRAQHIAGLYELANQEYMANVAKKISVDLLREFPSCGIKNLKYLLQAAIRHGDRTELLQVTRCVLSVQGRVAGSQRVHWYAYAYLLSPDEFSAKINCYVGRDPEKAGLFIQLVAFPSWSKGSNPEISLHPKSIFFLISLSGKIFRPSDTEPVERELGGSYKVTERMEAVRKINLLIQNLGNDVTPDAIDSLVRLGQDSRLAEWRDALAHAAALQARRRREAQFKYPTVDEVVATLNHGPPANPADLQAVVVEHLQILAEEMRHGPTDGYKAFWNVDSYGHPETPRPENDCRDRLLERLRPELVKLGINAEPEGHYAQDKRADIKVLYRNINIPVEIKRHYHGDLWTAPLEQLKKLYSRDPAAGGRGIYLVLWFGTDVKKLPKPPRGIARPTQSADLETAIRELLPEEERIMIEVIVFDCSRPGK